MRWMKMISALLLALMTYVVHGQSISGISLNFGFPDTYDGLVFAPSGQFDSNNHTWSVGPTILFSYGDQIEQREKTKLSGFFVGYTNYIHGQEQKVNLFYSFDLWIQRIKDEQISNYFNTATNSFESISIEQKDTIAQLFLKLGLSWRLSEKWAINQAIGVGMNATSRSTTSPFSDFDDAFYNQDWLLKTSIGYRFN